MTMNASTTFVIRHSDFVIRAAGASRLLLQAGDDADKRRKESKHDRADNQRQKHDHDGLEHRCEGRNRVIDLIIVHIGNLQEHIWKFTGFFAHIDHAGHHRRKSATGFQRLNDRFAFLYAVVHV